MLTFSLLSPWTAAKIQKFNPKISDLHPDRQNIPVSSNLFFRFMRFQLIISVWRLFFCSGVN